MGTVIPFPRSRPVTEQQKQIDGETVTLVTERDASRLLGVTESRLCELLSPRLIVYKEMFFERAAVDELARERSNAR